MIRAVLDTNVAVAGLLKSTGPPGEILRLLHQGAITAIFSRELIDELAAVLAYPKLKTKYRLGRDDLEAIAGLFALRGDLVEIVERIRACRHPDDDRFIETAVAGRADYLVSGDQNLLLMRKFRGLSIVRPVEFVVLVASSRR